MLLKGAPGNSLTLNMRQAITWIDFDCLQYDKIVGFLIFPFICYDIMFFIDKYINWPSLFL